MSQAAVNSELAGTADSFKRPRKFRRNRQHANSSGRSLPISLQRVWGRLNQMFGRMHSTLGVADERTLQMDSHGSGPARLRSFADGLSQVFQSAQRAIFSGCDGGWQIGAHPARGKHGFNG